MPTESQRPSKLGLWIRSKYKIFIFIEILIDLRKKSPKNNFFLNIPLQPQPAIWIFISTIGELNAIEPWLDKLIKFLPTTKLVLITDHGHYQNNYEARYPQAVVCVSQGHSTEARTLSQHYPPKLLVVAEIPCLPSDAPCRFSVAFVVEAKRKGAAAVIINGWLYGYKPACKMDRIERQLFEKSYLRMFEMICVQTEEAEKFLIEAGVDKNRVAIVGNIKFDAMKRIDWTLDQAKSPELLRALIKSGRPVVVAGCVTSETEQSAVLDAFCTVKLEYADALLVLAPRHPEVSERMEMLSKLVENRALTTHFRSALGSSDLPADSACLVLDTIGDLRDFYASAIIAHVGVDHNVLEPLGFERPVTVMPGWEPTYPSFPIYKILVTENILLQATDAAQLAGHWLEAIKTRSSANVDLPECPTALTRAKGAVDRHFAALSPWIARLR